MSQTALDHRRFSRVPVGFRVKVMADYLTIPAEGVNISQGGVYLHTAANLPVGKACHIIVFIEEGSSVEKILAWGAVARRDSQGLAIRFTQILGEQGMERLQDFLLRHAPDPGLLLREFEEGLANPA